MPGSAEEILKLCADKKVGVSVSGGSDSMCLLDFILRSGIISKSNILVINFEHGIRGAESKEDSRFVADFCRKNGLKLYFKAGDIPTDAQKSGKSLETEARIFRKKEYESIINSGVAEKILLAHNLDDHTESVLMHIFRGCGIKGLIGPAAFDGYIVRPLITAAKSEILEYNRKYSVPFVTDSTNNDLEYNRNFLRSEVLPLIKQRWPGVDTAVSGLSRIAADCHGRLTEADSGMLIDGDSVLIDADKLNGISISRGFAALGIHTDLTKKHIDAVASLAEKQCGAGIDVPQGGRAVREYDFVRLTIKSETVIGQQPFKTGQMTAGGFIISTTTCDPMPEKGRLRFDSAKLPASCVVRSRRDGDIFVPYGGRRKLLSDYLTDKKIPKYKRDRLMLIADGSEVYIIAGVEISDKLKIDGATKKAFEINLQQKKNAEEK